MLIQRQKCVLYLLQRLQKCNKIQLAKLLFLLEKETKTPLLCSFYSFIPYKYGPYSFELFHDIDTFEKENIIVTNGNTITYEHKQIHLPSTLKNYIHSIISKYTTMDDTSLIDYVYQHYPEYTIFSELNKHQQYKRDKKGIFTIGYQGRSIDNFLHILVTEKTHILVDIRYNPWSMKYGFTKYTLKTLCEKLDIEYQHIPEFGIPGDMRENLDTENDYKKLFQKYEKHLRKQFQQLQYLKQQAKTKRLALMCFEKDPAFCHRHILGKHLQQMGVSVTIT